MSGVRVDAFLADAVAVDAGRLHAQAAGWDVVRAAALPFVLERIGLGLLLRVPAGGPRVAHELEVRLEGPAGEELPLAPDEARLRGTFALGASDGAELPERTVAAGINVEDAPLTAAGRHRFVIAVDGTDVATVPFAVVLSAASAAGRGSASPA